MDRYFKQYLIVFVMSKPTLNVKPELDILYQDEYLVAVNKPAGLFVHRSYMDKDEIYFALQLTRDQVGQYVYPVHRLDRPTSGVLLFALNPEIAGLMSEMFFKGTIQKTYYALTRGHLTGEQTIDYPLKEKLDRLGDKDVSRNKEPQQAVTVCESILTATLPISVGKFDSVRYSLLRLQPKTGRRHQIRRHLAHLRHPIIGDINYGDNKQNPFFREFFGFRRLMLLAKKLEFMHPVTNRNVLIETDFDQQWHHVFDKLSWDSAKI